MHLAFVSPLDPADVGSWSGIPYHMIEAFAQHVDRLSIVAPLDTTPRWMRGVRRLQNRARGHSYSSVHTADAAARMADHASREIRRLRPDAVIGSSSLPVGGIEAACPVGFWTDATFESMLYFYAEFGLLSPGSVAEGHRVERAAIQRADLAVYASDFAAASAVDYYGAAPEAVRVVPLGANLTAPPSAAEVVAAAEARPLDRCTLLFLGVEWVRKGGDVAVLVADALNAAGLPTDLHVVGCTPELDRPRPYVHSHGFLSKATPAGRATLNGLLRDAHFLVMPVRAEAFGCVFCEASAYAVPSVATTSGGAGSAVTDGVNGFLFGPRPAADAIADRILETLRTPGAYAALSRSSRDEFDRRLNWTVATAEVVSALGALV